MKVPRRPIFSPGGDDKARAHAKADLGGFRPIPSDWAIDWQFFIDLGPGPEPTALGPLNGTIKREPQKAYKIDTLLVHPLGDLPPQIASHPNILALRNLERGRTFSLPTGQQVARALDEEPIPDDKLMFRKANANDRDKLQPLKEIAPGFAGRAPLWAYILSEAQVTSWGEAGNGASLIASRSSSGPWAAGSSPTCSPPCFAATPRLPQAGRPVHADRRFTRGARTGLAELINVALGRAP